MKRLIKAIIKKLFAPVFRRYHLILDKIDKIEYIINKLSLIDGIVELKEVRFFVPNAPRDTIQNCHLSFASFYEQDILEDLDRFLHTDSVVLDVGANVGNHTVYWGKITNVKKIYSFEPLASTFFILSRNIEINRLGEKVKLYNIGLSDRATRGTIEAYHNDNIGGTSINKGENGNISLNALDNIREILEEPVIDFVKIDVEGREKDALNGATEFFQRHKPTVFIESFAGENQYAFVYDFFKKRGYNEPKPYQGDNYLFIHQSAKV